MLFTRNPFGGFLMKSFGCLPRHPLEEAGKVGLIFKTQLQSNFFNAPLADEQLMLCLHNGSLVEQGADAFSGFFFQDLVESFGADMQFVRIESYLLFFLEVVFQ